MKLPLVQYYVVIICDVVRYITMDMNVDFGKIMDIIDKVMDVKNNVVYKQM